MIVLLLAIGKAAITMLRTRRIKDLDQLRSQAFSPPQALRGTIEEAEFRSEAWEVIMAFGSISGGARWVAILPASREAFFFTEGDRLTGRWDSELEVFFPEEGAPLNLFGNPVSLSSIEEEMEEGYEYGER